MKQAEKLLVILIATIVSFTAKAQLCSGSLGDPVIKITFGAGPNPGPQLSAATTNYIFNPTTCPNDGFYTVANSTSNCFGNSWHTLNNDHTGDPNGYFMLVNASILPQDFYVDTVRGLCSNTTFEFAAWVVNVLKNSACGGVGITPNLTFKIETLNGVVIKQFTTGNISADAFPIWKQYGFFFQTAANSTDVVIRITNTNPGGCGNDLALDDITFRPCGPLLTASVVGVNGSTNVNRCDYDTASLQFTATISTGYTNPSFQWQVSSNTDPNWKDIPGATKSTYTRPPASAGTYQYRLISAESGNISSSSCRVASNIITVVDNARPATSVTNNSPQCDGTAITLSANGGVSYIWTHPDKSTDSLQSISVSRITDSGKYFVKVTSAAGCIGTDSTVVSFLQNPTARWTIAKTACEQAAVAFINTSTAPAGQAISSYSWDFADGNSESTKNPSHIYTVAKDYQVSLVTTTDKQCSDTLLQTVTVHEPPKPDFILPEICLSDPFAAFIDASTISDNSMAQFIYHWNFADPGANQGNPNSSTLKDPKHIYTAIGVYNVELTVTSKDGCIADTIKPFTVNGALPLAKFTVQNANSLCSNNDIVITDNSSVNFGNITKTEIYWDFQNNPTNKITDEFPSKGKQYSFRYADFGSPATKSFTIKYVAYSGINCVNETQQNITLQASPKVQFTPIPAICQSANQYSITQARELNGINGTAAFTGNGVSTSGLFDPQIAGAGTHNIIYTFTANNGCSDSALQTIKVYPQPVANAGADKTLLEGGSVIIEATASGNITSYLWSPNDHISDNTILAPTVSPVNDITYTLTVTSADNCVTKDDVFIKVFKTPIIPNAFSPNGDGINDTWIIDYLNSYPGVTVQVFNRYGQVVYRSIGYSKAWDGTFNGQPLPVGTYYYVIDRKVAAPKISGWVAILR